MKIQVLEERLRPHRVRLLGPQSETLSDLQLALLVEEEPGVTIDEVAAETKREPIMQAPRKERKAHPGRERLPENLPRVEKVIGCQEQTCKRCGRETSIIGYDESEHLDVEPARYFVRVTKREKRACRGCEQGNVTTAPLPPRIIEKGVASDGVVIGTVVAKYCDHTPLYRQAAILEREAGVEIGRATLDGWVMRVGEMLQPVTAARSHSTRSIRRSCLRAPLTEISLEIRKPAIRPHRSTLLTPHLSELQEVRRGSSFTLPWSLTEWTQGSTADPGGFIPVRTAAHRRAWERGRRRAPLI